MAKKARKHRVRSPFGFVPPAGKLSAGAMRREDQAKARREFPELMCIFDAIKEDLREKLATGRRFAYRESLSSIYQLICDWDKDGCLRDNQQAIARLRGVPLRANANRFSGIVAICSDRDRKTVSRWSQELDGAFEMEIPPRRLMRFLENPSSMGKPPLLWGPRP
jgi:hypothetical protein